MDQTPTRHRENATPAGKPPPAHVHVRTGIRLAHGIGLWTDWPRVDAVLHPEPEAMPTAANLTNDMNGLSDVIGIGQRAPARRPEASPFLKWAGGKGRIKAAIFEHFPDIHGRYFEPFVGGGAIFFGFRPGGQVQLSDVNGELINVYRCVRDNVEELIEDLGRHRYEKTYYYSVRAQDPLHLSDLERASRVIFLNRTCFNGLYRVNRRGQFNVPFGRYSNPKICNTERLRAASAALSGCAIGQLDYATACADVKMGDIVYFDPPYDPISSTANFTSYAAGGFGRPEQERLADLFATLAGRGARVVLSNSDTPFIRDLYKDFQIHQIVAPRAISRKASTRKPVFEVIVTSI